MKKICKCGKIYYDNANQCVDCEMKEAMKKLHMLFNDYMKVVSMIDSILEQASDNDLYIISQHDEDLQIRYEATRQLQGRYKRKKAKHKKYWSSFKTFKEE